MGKGDQHFLVALHYFLSIRRDLQEVWFRFRLKPNVPVYCLRMLDDSASGEHFVAIF
jgi:hypothetical protein